MEIQAIAEEALGALRSRRQIAPFSSRFEAFDLDTAYRVTAAVRRLREAEGEIVLGRKIGFTNRTLWATFGVQAPIWGYVYDRSVRDLGDIGGRFPLDGLCEPRIEPEIAFQLARAPSPDMDEAALLGCVDWVAHAFEIVQSIYPAWKFTAADTVAACGMHGALLIGRRHRVSDRAADWLGELPAFAVALQVDGAVASQGHSSDVLGGPLSALRHLLGVLARDPDNPPLAAGEIITTGTLTQALPIARGEAWTTGLAGIALDPIGVTFI